MPALRTVNAAASAEARLPESAAAPLGVSARGVSGAGVEVSSTWRSFAGPPIPRIDARRFARSGATTTGGTPEGTGGAGGAADGAPVLPGGAGGGADVCLRSASDVSSANGSTYEVQNPGFAQEVGLL